MSELSEEEIIKDLTKYISFANKSENFANDNDFKWNTELSQRVQSLLDLYNKEKEKNKELEYSLKNNVVAKYCIRHKADDYESKGYIEIAGAMRELLEERN